MCVYIYVNIHIYILYIHTHTNIYTSEKIYIIFDPPFRELRTGVTSYLINAYKMQVLDQDRKTSKKMTEEKTHAKITLKFVLINVQYSLAYFGVPVPP